MTLATLDRITFYSSPDLKTWKKESEFGKDIGAHGGVWECPDLFPLQYNGEEIWVLIVSINPGGPNGGSATQYFTGTFDGHSFVATDTGTKWIDFGPDDYAGVTYFNTGDRKIFLGWMSNWQYAQAVPTASWRSAMTMPRDLSLDKVADKYYVRSTPSKEIGKLEDEIKSVSRQQTKSINITGETGMSASPSIIRLTVSAIDDFTITISIEAGEKTIAGYNRETNQYYIDRTASGETMYSDVVITAKGSAVIDQVQMSRLKPIW
jgi:fructan beta-fructosidase